MRLNGPWIASPVALGAAVTPPGTIPTATANSALRRGPTMDTELVSFRIDSELRHKAAAVCAELGFELHDVLRALVTQIARDGALPFALGTRSPTANYGPQAFGEYDTRLWSPLRPQLDAELAIALLGRFIADCSIGLERAAEASHPDHELAAQLIRERATAVALRRSLDVEDVDAVHEVIDVYGPRVRGQVG